MIDPQTLGLECPEHETPLNDDGICPEDGCSRNFVTAIIHNLVESHD